VSIEKILEGVARFQHEVVPRHKEMFEALASGQRPDALFITCSDSRIDPCLLTQTQPGELFICRVIGNIVPPYPDAVGGISATVEFAAAVLRVPDIIVCGHTDCGVMRGALNPATLNPLPAVGAWLKYAEVVERDPDPRPELILKVAEQNVVRQLDNLRTHPSVASRIAAGELRLHGWVYDIGPGEVAEYDTATQTFLPIHGQR
jgi:carbonic anhydrase